MRLSPNFELSEFVVSETASRLGIDNTPPFAAVARLALWCEFVGERIRARFGRPVVITSGYRCLKLNAAVDGATGSLHMTGWAADLTVPGVSVKDVCNAVIAMNLPFHEVINEYGAWAHVGLCNVGELPARRIYTAVKANDGVQYVRGIQ